MPEPIIMKLGVYIMAPDPISMAYFINPAHQSVSIYVSPIVARQRLGIHVPAAANILNNEELLVSSFSMRSVSYKRRVYVYPPIIARQWLGKHVPVATKNCWRRRFLCGPCRFKEK
jgi:hypothetical protein